MVWQENGKYGVYTGRTLRRPDRETNTPSKDRGFLIKTVTNPDLNFTDAEVRKILVNFRLEDGLNDDDIVKESRENRAEGWWGHGSSSFNVLYSLGKRKRWLIPAVLREKIRKDYDSEVDHNVVLVERVTSANGSYWQSSPRLKRGDCTGVCDGLETRKPKKRKFAHVGDLRGSKNDSNKTEIVYEVNHTESAPSWPNYLEHDWREFCDQNNKAKDKKKGEKNKRRLWGGYSRCELERTARQDQQKRVLDDEAGPDLEENEELLHNLNSFEKFASANPSPVTFDIGKYISEVLATSHSSKPKKRKASERAESKPTRGLNPASSELIKIHGKAMVVYIDPIESVCHDNGYHDNTMTSDHSGPVIPDVEVVEDEVISVNVDIQREKLNSQRLRERYAELYKEGSSLPRRFSIHAEDLSTQFVFTCYPDAPDASGEDIVKATVTVVSDALPSDKWQACREFLKNSFGSFVPGCKPEAQLSRTILPSCGFDTHNHILHRQSVMPFNLLYDVNRWSSKAVLPSEALADACDDQGVADTACVSTDLSIPATILCGICLCDFQQEDSNVSKDFECCCTAMKTCTHWFCNTCWKSYLSAQLQQGNTTIQCPEYECDALVDDVTVMGLLPGQFLKFSRMRQEKALEVSRKWQWCPGDKCNLVVMVTTNDYADVVVSKDVMTTKKIMTAIPVNCACGSSWCFACQKEPHWPASCAEAAFYRVQTDTYEKLVRAKTGGITSVHVKKCPICSYPIEKNQGCPHMTCTMCKGEFCWTCLGTWAKHRGQIQNCDANSKDEEEVELINDVGSSRFNKHLRVAVANRHARTSSVLLEKYSSLEKLKKALLSHEQIIAHYDGSCQASAPHKLLHKYKSFQVSRYLQAAADFKFQAHFVVEGVSMLMAVSKTRYCHDKLSKLVSTLLFLIDRLEERANNRLLLSKADTSHFQALLEAGRHCLSCIKKLCIKLHQK